VSVWETQHRLLSEQVTGLLSGELTDEEIVRLIIAARVLLARHQVDKRGRCRFCFQSRSRLWWPRRRICTVHQAFAVALNQPFKVVLDWFKDH